MESHCHVVNEWKARNPHLAMKTHCGITLVKPFLKYLTRLYWGCCKLCAIWHHKTTITIQYGEIDRNKKVIISLLLLFPVHKWGGESASNIILIITFLSLVPFEISFSLDKWTQKVQIIFRVESSPPLSCTQRNGWVRHQTYLGMELPWFTCSFLPIVVGAEEIEPLDRSQERRRSESLSQYPNAWSSFGYSAVSNPQISLP